MPRHAFAVFAILFGFLVTDFGHAQEKPDYLRQLQFEAADTKKSDWIHWGDKPNKWSSWTYHSNRLIPVYSYGISLDVLKGENSPYRTEAGLKTLYDEVPESTLNPSAEYFDQTDIFRLQQMIFAEDAPKELRKKNLILVVFDGMDWQTTQAASVYRHKKVLYSEGRGTGLSFLDYGVDGGNTDYGYVVTSAHNNGTKSDVNGQVLKNERSGKTGGYSWELGGSTPWTKSASATYLIGSQRDLPHTVTDSAASATSLMSGIKTYNSAINVDADGKHVVSIARTLQQRGISVGVVSNVPFNHATPASAYANNVTRNDYQDIGRDLVGLPSIANREALPGMDVVIGGGWGETSDDDRKKQGENYLPGNRYFADEDLKKIDCSNGGNYAVAQRTPGVAGAQALEEGVKTALAEKKRLFGFFGTKGGHLPFQTADGNYDPTRGVRNADVYKPEDISENPTLADMTSAALTVLSQNEKGFWLMVEAGDVDWANHNNNVDDSIGAVFSGEAAFDAITDWVEKNSSWEDTAVILTADHGHMMIVDDFDALIGKRQVAKKKAAKDKTEEAAKANEPAGEK